MRKDRTRIVWLLMLVIASVGCGQAKQKGKNMLSADGNKVVDYLLKDWEQQFSSTTIPHAMSNLDMEANDDLRLEIIEYFRDNTDKARNLRYWGSNNYVLTNTERRIAKYLLNTKRDEDRIPDIVELSTVIDAPEDEIRERLGFLAKVDLLETAQDRDIGYALVADAEMWGGPLRHNFHTVTYVGEKVFDVWWAIDFLLLVNSDEMAGKSLKIEDSCAHCSDAITVEIANGEITHLTPESVWVQRGGGWAVDNLFRSEEHLNAWLDKYPDYKQLNQMPIGEFLGQSVR